MPCPPVGLPAAAFATAGQSPDALFGAPIGAIKGEYAIGETPPGSKGIALRLMAQVVLKVIGWKLAGQAWPHPFFDRATGRPFYPLTVLTADARERLRPLCGPKP